MPLEAVLKALSEPRRLQILRLISGSELSSGEIAARFEVSHPAISQHLRVLTDAGLATVRHTGTRRFYRARPAGMEELRAFFEEYWDTGPRRPAPAAEVEERRRQIHLVPDMPAARGMLYLLGSAHRKEGAGA